MASCKSPTGDDDNKTNKIKYLFKVNFVQSLKTVKQAAKLRSLFNQF